MKRELVLSTPRLAVTSWLVEDAAELQLVHSDPDTMRYVRSGRPESSAEVAQLVDRYRAEHAARGWTTWRLADDEGRLVGRAGFGGAAERRGLSFTIRRSHWGRGLATEVGLALVAWHQIHAHAVPLRGLVAVGNDASARVLAKCGFDEVGEEDYAGTACRVFLLTDPDEAVSLTSATTPGVNET